MHKLGVILLLLTGCAMYEPFTVDESGVQHVYRPRAEVRELCPPDHKYNPTRACYTPGKVGLLTCIEEDGARWCDIDVCKVNKMRAGESAQEIKACEPKWTLDLTKVIPKLPKPR